MTPLTVEAAVLPSIRFRKIICPFDCSTVVPHLSSLISSLTKIQLKRPYLEGHFVFAVIVWGLGASGIVGMGAHWWKTKLIFIRGSVQVFGFEDNFHLTVVARDLNTLGSAIVAVLTDGKLPRVIGTVVLVLWLKKKIRKNSKKSKKKIRKNLLVNLNLPQ